MASLKFPVGIDLGTTYSSLMYLDARESPVAVPNAQGSLATPSVVYFLENGEGTLVGEEALEQGCQQPHRMIAHAKRELGNLDAVWDVDDVLYTPVDVQAIILRQLLRDAEQQIGPVREAVITVPAHFVAHQRQLTIEAGKRAGLETVHIVNEPVAAALCYALGHWGDGGVVMSYLRDDCTVLVYDLGGGTFDLSLVRYDDKQLRVLAATGEQQLGGLDWDTCLLKEYLALFKEQYVIDWQGDPAAVLRLRRSAETVKCSLSSQDEAVLYVDCQGRSAEYVVKRHEFEELTAHLVEQTRTLTEKLLRDAGVAWTDIDRIIPVGGSTHMPAIQAVLQSFAEQGTMIHRIPPETSVAQGAALFAGIIRSNNGDGMVTGHTSSRLANYRTSNVTASCLSIIVHDGKRRRKHVLIEKNTPLPVSARVTVGTARADQRRVTVRVIEGDTGGIDHSQVICKCSIDELPAGLQVGSRVDVDLMYDADGLLHIVAGHRRSGKVAAVSTMYSRDLSPT